MTDYPARWLHRTAVAIVCLVWPLIWVGGLVTTYDAGMAVRIGRTPMDATCFCIPTKLGCWARLICSSNTDIGCWADWWGSSRLAR